MYFSHHSSTSVGQTALTTFSWTSRELNDDELNFLTRVLVVCLGRHDVCMRWPFSFEHDGPESSSSVIIFTKNVQMALFTGVSPPIYPSVNDTYTNLSRQVVPRQWDLPRTNKGADTSGTSKKHGRGIWRWRGRGRDSSSVCR